ncbi:lipid asymmetry maintenance protein MlaB [Treponema sp.]|uniref:STAS domain-containing protein n=1 Tax=Treponema sp. TaxID=166 RepID=UPI00388DE551
MAAKKTESVTIKWHGTAGIEQAHALRDELLAAFKNNKILLDISEVEDIDITGVQLIVSAKKEAQKSNKEFFIIGKIPDVIVEFISASSISLEEYALPEGEEIG